VGGRESATPALAALERTSVEKDETRPEMKTGLKQVLKAVTPRPIWWAIRGVAGWRWFEGDYATWHEAEAAGSGYAGDAIVERARVATQMVRDGRAAFERDGVVFTEPVAENGLMAAFRRIADDSGGVRRVLDFGGALGTTYWRHRGELARHGLEKWDVVEQVVFVSTGRQFEQGPLRFFESVVAAETAARHDVLLASTSLQYLAQPDAALNDWMGRGFEWMLFNNLPLHRGRPDRIALQRVPPEIYAASYPVWFFNREKLLARFTGRYDIVQEFPSEAEWQVGLRRYASTGLLLKRKGGA
jgi:putative methyltransferase (TIGR04325 family)